MPSSSRSRGSGGAHGAPRAPLMAPMSERQQMALVMQLTSQNNQPAVPSPAEERKRTRQQRNLRGETPLHVAAIRGDHEQVKKLLDQGQDPDFPDFAGWTALHEACSYGWLQVVQVLVEGGANINAKGLDDDTPLHDASTSGNLKMVQFLVEHGAEPFAKNTKGKTPSDYAAPHIYTYLQSLKDSNAKASHITRERNDSGKKGGNASTGGGETSKRSSMDSLAQEHDAKETAQDKGQADGKDDGHNQLSSGVVSSSQDEPAGAKRPYYEEGAEAEAEDELAKRKKRKDEDKEPMAKPAPVARNATGPRILTGTKPPGPASKTGATPLGKSGAGAGANKGGPGASTGKGAQAGQKGGGGGKLGAQAGHPGKSSGGAKGASGSQTKPERKSPVASPKAAGAGADEDEAKAESSAPKVPPLKIVIPAAANRAEQEGEGGAGQRGGGKGRGSSATLPYVIPCTSNDPGQASDSSDGNSDDKRSGEGGKVKLTAAQRVLRSHRTNDCKEDKDRTSPGSGERSGPQQALGSNKSPPPSASGQDNDHQAATVSSSSSRDRSESKLRRHKKSKKEKKAKRHRRENEEIRIPFQLVLVPDVAGAGGPSVELHPRKRKIKGSKESHSREAAKAADAAQESTSHAATHCNPYQMYIHIRKQIDRRQKGLFPVKPKPPKDFNKYLMNRCTYTLQSNVNPEPQVELPPSLPAQMKDEFLLQEKERHRLRVQHLVEKEKLVLAVEQEILRVHGRAERAVANQSLPFSVCTILRDEEVYNVLAPEQEEKRNAQRSRCNGRQINSWLQEVDDKWEKIKEGMLRRQHTEAETLHAVQTMTWEWKLKEVGLCDYKTTPKIDPTHVPQIHVTNFDLPA